MNGPRHQNRSRRRASCSLAPANGGRGAGGQGNKTHQLGSQKPNRLTITAKNRGYSHQIIIRNYSRVGLCAPNRRSELLFRSEWEGHLHLEILAGGIVTRNSQELILETMSLWCWTPFKVKVSDEVSSDNWTIFPLERDIKCRVSPIWFFTTL